MNGPWTNQEKINTILSNLYELSKVKFVETENRTVIPREGEGYRILDFCKIEFSRNLFYNANIFNTTELYVQNC